MLRKESCIIRLTTIVVAQRDSTMNESRSRLVDMVSFKSKFRLLHKFPIIASSPTMLRTCNTDQHLAMQTRTLCINSLPKQQAPQTPRQLLTWCQWLRTMGAGGNAFSTTLPVVSHAVRLRRHLEHGAVSGIAVVVVVYKQKVLVGGPNHLVLTHIRHAMRRNRRLLTRAI